MSQQELNPTDSEHNSQGDEPHSAAKSRPEGSGQAVNDLLPAYSIGATDPEENELVRAELASNPAAADELAEYASLARALLHSAEPRPPSPSLAGKLQAAMRKETKPEEQPASVSWWERIFGADAQPVWPRLAVAGALVLLLALNVLTGLQVRSLRTENEFLAAQLSNQREALAMIAADDVEVYTLSSPDGAGDAHASVRWVHDSNVAVLTAEDFPGLEPDMAYQMWLIRDGERTDGGLFTVDSTGAGMLLVVAPEPLDTFDGMGITPEPATGSPGPTSPPVVTAKL